MSTTTIIENMKSKFNAEAAEGLDLVFQFNIDEAEPHHLVIKDGDCSIVAGEHNDANVTLIMDEETFAGIATGQLDGMQAFMTGKLRVEGDMMLATKLGQLFPA